MMVDYVPGWVDDPESVAVVAGAQPFPFFSMTPAAERQTIPPEVFLWKAREKITGKPWPGRNQGQVGSCVAFGTAAAIEATMAAEILAGQAEEIKDLCQEVIYAGSRVEVGGRRINGDGSVGAWAAEFVRRWGVVDREVYGNEDLRRYDETRCRLWGRTGVPDSIETVARLHPVRAVTLVKTFGQACQALASGYGIAMCSSRGFVFQRDADGFCKASGTWNHCMALLGYKEGSRPGGWICNSWGDNKHTGPTGAGEAPRCGFWADAEIVDRMLGAGDSWAFSGLDGFPARRINWSI